MKRSFRQIMKDAVALLRTDLKEAKWAIIVIIAYFVLSRMFFLGTCPMVMITGFPCPACGLSRAGMALLGLDFAVAWHMHPFIYAIVVFAAAFAWRRYVLRKRGKRFVTVAAIVLVILMTLFYIWRMVHEFPGEPPMSYYSGNLLQRFGL